MFIIEVVVCSLVELDFVFVKIPLCGCQVILLLINPALVCE